MHHLVIQTAFLGDLLLSIPLYKRIKQINPNAKISLVCRRGLGPLMGSLGIIDHVYEVNKSDADSYNLIVEQLKGQSFDYLISPHESFRTALFAKKIKAQHKLSFKTWWNILFFNKRIDRPMHFPDALRQLSLLQLIDDKTVELFSRLDQSYWNENTQKAFEDKLAIPEWASLDVREAVLKKSLTVEVPGNFVAIAPGSVWPTKRWQKESFAQLAQKLTDMNLKVVCVGGSDESDVCEEIANHVGGTNLAGRTNLIESMRVLAEARLLVSNDSGPQHMAAAVNTPVLSIFGPTTPFLGYRPWIQKSDVAQIDLSCRPCGKHGAKECPIGTHECMKNLSVDLVLQKAKRLLL